MPAFFVDLTGDDTPPEDEVVVKIGGTDAQFARNAGSSFVPPWEWFRHSRSQPDSGSSSKPSGPPSLKNATSGSSDNSAPVVAEPVVAEPVVAEPVVAEPVVAEPVTAEPVVAEPEPESEVPESQSGEPEALDDNSSRPSIPARFFPGDAGDEGEVIAAGLPSISALVEPPTPRSSRRVARDIHTPQTQARKVDWTVDKIAEELGVFLQEVKRDHARLVRFRLEEAEQKTSEPRHLSTVDYFANMKSKPIPDTDNSSEDAMVMKYKLHFGDTAKSKTIKKRLAYPAVCIKSDKDAVPRYRFHHVEISKNILTPNTMLNFVPHLRDMEPSSAEEKKYLKWIEELDSLDIQSGFKTLDRPSKILKRQREEHAATVSTYLDRWLKRLAIEGCTKSALIRYMAGQKAKDDAITPQQKTSILDRYGSDDDSSERDEVAQMFTEAFDRVFDSEANSKRVALRDVLMLDKSIETIVDNNNKRAKETPSSQKQGDQDLIQEVETSLGSYSVLGCLICFSHDCEHGEYDADNQRRTYSVDGLSGGVGTLLKKKWVEQLKEQGLSQNNNVPGARGLSNNTPCKNYCYRSYDTGNPFQMTRPWTDGEIMALKAVYASLGHSQVKAQCAVSHIFGRKCWDVYKKMKELKLSLPDVDVPTETIKVKPVSWYDRKKKQLLGDWADCTVTHEHSSRELSEPCHHDGPCSVANGCPCMLAQPLPVLCERFCHCTAETCPIKFTGCACHSVGKTCLQRQKEGRPCICVQLNRECDPVLCKGCGAAERADPENAHDEQLHLTGCQNVSLQRNLSKVVLLGQSQLEGCGYGLFTAENIAQDEFVIEYTGELITHDEGVRREARRGDVFNEACNASYLFTLLEHEGIWVDAAIYGNLSRYINHASESDKKGCNITPKILYVNGEYRIRFNAIRDIKAGEELFFNYGENFPNLTKRLLEEDKDRDDDNNSPVKKRKTGVRGRGPTKKTKINSKEVDFAPIAKMSGSSRGKARKVAPDPMVSTNEEGTDWWEDLVLDVDGEDMGDDYEDATPRRRQQRKKRGGRRPGAGRKKKQPVPVVAAPDASDAAGAPGAPGAGEIEDDDFRPEISDSQAETPSEKAGEDDTPSRRRFRHARVAASAANRTAGSGSEIGVAVNRTAAAPAEPAVPPVKSRRGGARPGAGRKPKRPKVVPPSASPLEKPQADKNATQPIPAAGSSEPRLSKGDESTDSALHSIVAASTTPLAAPAGQAAAAPAGPATATVAGRKRKADDMAVADSQAQNDEVSFVPGRFVPINANEDNSEGGANDAGDYDYYDDDDQDVVDRATRKRQKPSRYRDEE